VPPVSPPRFIVLEGIDGSGTTTQADRLMRHLESLGRKAIATREPSTGPVGRLLREALLSQHKIDGQPMSGATMALLFAADRRDHLQREVEPALKRGFDVVCDRYQWSSLAYQPAESQSLDWIAHLAAGIRVPDLTLLLDLPVPVAAQRRKLALRPDERYDADETQNVVAANYRRLAAADPNAQTIDASAEIDTVSQFIFQAVSRIL
jgi:dTMP kinase